MNRELIKVLIVEDSKVDARLIREMLRGSTDISYEIVHSENLSDSLELLESNEFDVLLLDLGLSESQGLATLLRVQKEYPETPKIVLTGTTARRLPWNRFNLEHRIIWKKANLTGKFCNVLSAIQLNGRGCNVR